MTIRKTKWPVTIRYIEQSPIAALLMGNHHDGAAGWDWQAGRMATSCLSPPQQVIWGTWAMLWSGNYGEPRWVSAGWDWWAGQNGWPLDPSPGPQTLIAAWWMGNHGSRAGRGLNSDLLVPPPRPTGFGELEPRCDQGSMANWRVGVLEGEVGWQELVGGQKMA